MRGADVEGGYDPCRRQTAQKKIRNGGASMRRSVSRPRRTRHGGARSAVEIVPKRSGGSVVPGAAGFCRYRCRCLWYRRDGFRRRSFLSISGLSAYPNSTDVGGTHLFFAALACRISGCPLFSGMASRPPGSLDQEKGFGDHGFHVHRDGDEASHAWFEPG